MKSDFELQQDIVDELDFDLSLSSEHVAVSARDGIVVLSGFVPTYADKYAAERAAFRVAGVKAVAEEIEVKLPGTSVRSDEQIAEAAVSVIQCHVRIPSSVRISVEDGVVIKSAPALNRTPLERHR